MRDRIRMILNDFKLDKLKRVPVNKMFIGLVLNLKWILVGGANPRRYEICRTCPLNDDNFCEGCACYLPSKTSIATEVCPLGKWK